MVIHFLGGIFFIYFRRTADDRSSLFDQEPRIKWSNLLGLLWTNRLLEQNKGERVELPGERTIVFPTQTAATARITGAPTVWPWKQLKGNLGKEKMVALAVCGVEISFIRHNHLDHHDNHEHHGHHDQARSGKIIGPGCRQDNSGHTAPPAFPPVPPLWSVVKGH